MSRVAKNPVTVPAGVEVKFGTESLTVKGKNGELSMPLHQEVKVALEDGQITFAAADSSARASSSRAATFSAGVPASSRSKMIASAGRSRAFSMARALAAGI